MESLAYQPVLLHRLIRINIKIKFIANNYNYPSHAFFHSLLQIGPFVPVPKGYLSRFWNRDSAAGTKALVPGGRTGTKGPSR